MDSSHVSWENDDLFIKIAATALDILVPSDPNVVPVSQTPRSTNFLRFHDFIGFIL